VFLEVLDGAQLGVRHGVRTEGEGLCVAQAGSRRGKGGWPGSLAVEHFAGSESTKTAPPSTSFMTWHLTKHHRADAATLANRGCVQY
jgi:hypothetical protein